MRLAVISDIHGNCIALDAVLADLKQVQHDQVVCLGDAIQGGAEPALTVARLREIGCPIVMGNADAYVLTGASKEPASPEREKKLGEVREWTLSQLTDADREFMAAFVPTVTIALGGDRSVLCFHGSPDSFDEILLPTTAPEEWERMLHPYLPHIMTGGHTHMQQMRRLGATESFFFNPGSVGFAYSHFQPDGEFHCEAWAEYALISTDEGRVSLEFRRVPFDRDAVIEAHRSSGRPYADEAIRQYRKD